ncbi:nitrous oxide reductase accessory protein NosL [Pseudoxanthomonas mexicana]|uniref:nitrous oxide reductase accessory protein NosL n=1 Tax=Pseudoxanthomonas mexicana TaxID=128785 RepID=UPI00398B0F77
MMPAFRTRALSLGLTAAALLAGCGEKSAQTATLAPAEIETGTACVLDGMLLADYPGPKAQIHYAGQEQPEFFCDTVELFNTLLAGEQARAVRAVYVQDMGQADWEEPRGHWIDAKAAFYVHGSKVHGSMGPTFASFAQRADAEAFAGEHGGQVLAFGEVTKDMVDLRGGALHDSHM